MPRATRSAPSSSALSPPTGPRPTLSQDERMAYRIGRGEMGVLTFEPYKSHLLPLWRFRTPDIARQSSKLLWDEFEKFGQCKDFVGQDMARKFIQMGFTRSKRYANHKGGRKYEHNDGDGGGNKTKQVVLPKSEHHSDKMDKEEASLIFKEVWARCKQDDVYLRLKGEFQKEQKTWDKEQKALNKS